MKRIVALLLILVLSLGPAGLVRAARYVSRCCPPQCCESAPVVVCPPAVVSFDSCSPCEGSTAPRVEQRVERSSAAPVTESPTESPTPAPAAEHVEPLPPTTPQPALTDPVVPAETAPPVEETPAPATVDPATEFPAPTTPETTPDPVTPDPSTAFPAPDTRYPAPAPTTPVPTVPETTPPQPETQPAPSAPAVDDIFGGFGGTSTPTDPAAPAPTTPAPAETPATETTPATPPPTEGTTPGSDDLFNLGASLQILDEAGGWASVKTRQWNDASGLHACEARLAGATPSEVVLDRADGKLVRVPYRDLSDADLQFVQRQIEARRVQLAAYGKSKFVATQSDEP